METIFTPKESSQNKYEQIAESLQKVESRITKLKMQDGTELSMPEDLTLMLLNAVQAMQSGLSVSLIPREARMTTQQAADFLNMSRPTFIKLANDYGINFEMVGKHRRVLFNEIAEMQNKLRSDRAKALDDLIALQSELGLYKDSDK